MTYSGSLAAAENLPNELLDLEEYLAYEQVRPGLVLLAHCSKVG
jgi:hypothetical protein